MILVDKLLIGGIGWVLRRVGDAAVAQLYDEGSLREELLAAEMQLELGEIDAAGFEAIEADVLARIREVQARKRGDTQRATEAGDTRLAIESIEADTGDGR